MSDCSDMEYSSDNECEYDDYYNTGKSILIYPNGAYGNHIAITVFN